ARADERQLDAASIRPGIQRFALKLRAVIHSNGGRKAAVVGEPLEHSDHASSRDRGVDLDRRTLAAAVVDNRRPRSRRPSANQSETKSIDQLSFVVVGFGKGRRSNGPTLLRLRRRTARPASRYSLYVFFQLISQPSRRSST